MMTLSPVTICVVNKLQIITLGLGVNSLAYNRICCWSSARGMEIGSTLLINSWLAYLTYALSLLVKPLFCVLCCHLHFLGCI